MWMFDRKPASLPTAADALPDRPRKIPVPERHLVHGTSLTDVPDGHRVAHFGMGCFWGAERKLWKIPGVYSTAAGYQGGITANPTYEDACSGRTGHTEVVRVVYDPAKVTLDALLKVFWESHDPTQGMRQGNDRGTQYRSAIYVPAGDLATVERSRELYQKGLTAAGLGSITTEIREAPAFYFAEEYHQQYLEKNPGGYCGLKGTGVSCVS